MLKNKGGSRDWREYHIRTYQPLHHVKFLRMQRNRGGSLTRDRAGIKSTSISSLSILISYEVKNQKKKSWGAFSPYLNITKAKKEGRHYVECLGSRKDHRTKTTADAILGLKKFEVVVVTSRMEAGIARVALALGCDAVNWTFHSQKRVLGRPTIDQAPPAVQEQLNALVAQDMAVWEAADTIAAEREALPDARAALTELIH